MDNIEKHHEDEWCRENKTSNDDNNENRTPDEDRKKIMILKTQIITLN